MWEKQQAPGQRVLGEDGPIRPQGKGLARKTGGDAMWYLPLRITLELKKTRTSWQLTIRVFFQ